MKITEIHLGFLGFGHMGQVIFQALDKSQLIPRSKMLFHRRDPSKARENEQKYGITSTSIQDLVDRSNLLLICVRPNQAEFAFKDLVKAGIDLRMVVSVMAGIKIATIQKLSPRIEVARAMPNIASEISKGMTLLSFCTNPSLEFRSCVHLLFSALGNIAEIAESQMDVGSAIAGSGPAFVLEMIEVIARFGEKQGLPYGKALTMTAQTFLGGAELVLKGGVPEDLITQIATTGGMTIEGLKVLKEKKLDQLLEAVLTASSERSKKFSKEFF